MVVIQAAGARRLLPQTFFDSRAILSWNTGTSCRKKCRRKKQWPGTPCLRGRKLASEMSRRLSPAAAVVEFKAAISPADGILIATPEYNDGIPGVLTTAIDWGSRPPGAAPLAGKPVALQSARSPRLLQRSGKRRLFGQYLVQRGDRGRALAHGRG